MALKQLIDFFQCMISYSSIYICKYDIFHLRLKRLYSYSNFRCPNKLCAHTHTRFQCFGFILAWSLQVPSRIYIFLRYCLAALGTVCQQRGVRWQTTSISTSKIASLCSCLLSDYFAMVEVPARRQIFCQIEISQVLFPIKNGGRCDGFGLLQRQVLFSQDK